MKQPSHPNLAGKTIACFVLGVASFVLGLCCYFFTEAVTVLSLLGFFAGTAAVVLAILVRKARPDNPPLGATIGLIGGIVGVLWNLVFFVACSNLACGAANIF